MAAQLLTDCEPRATPRPVHLPLALLKTSSAHRKTGCASTGVGHDNAGGLLKRHQINEKAEDGAAEVVSVHSFVGTSQSRNSTKAVQLQSGCPKQTSRRACRVMKVEGKKQ